MPRQKPSEAVLDQLADLLSRGFSHSDAAAAMGRPKSTITAWARLDRVATRPVPAPPKPEALAPEEPIDTLELVRVMIRDLHADVQQFRSVGDSRSASSGAATLSRLATLLKQLGAEHEPDADRFSCPRSELAHGDSLIAERMRLLAERAVPGIAAPGGIRCADCARALGIRLGTAAPPPITT